MAGQQKSPGIALIPAKGGGLVVQTDCTVACPGCKQPIPLTAGMSTAEILAEMAKPCPH